MANESVEVGGNHTGYTVRVDAHPYVWVDVVDSWTNIDKHFDFESVETVFADQVIEHLLYYDQHKALLSTKEILKPGGMVELITPDLEEQFAMLNRGVTQLSNVQVTLYGGQDTDLNSHRFVHTKKSLYNLLTKTGFVVKNIRSENGSVFAKAMKPEDGYELLVKSGCVVYRRIPS